MTTFAPRREGAAAVALFLAGLIFGAWALRPPEPAHASQVAIGAATSIPAIPFGPNELLLVKDRQGLYFIVGPNGAAAPIRFKDTDLRTVPSESLLRAP